MFTRITEKITDFIATVPFDTLVIFAGGSYLAIFALVLVLGIIFKKFKRASKRPFLCLTNAYAGVTLALFLLEYELQTAVMAAAVFWVAGYVLYGLLCALSIEKSTEPRVVARANTVTAMPVPVPVAQPAKAAAAEVRTPAAKNNVRLEHAVAVTDKLLSKNLSKGDRQELEKLKNTLAVLQIKGTLTPTEAEILNENFNALLKLMAKYNV